MTSPERSPEVKPGEQNVEQNIALRMSPPRRREAPSAKRRFSCSSRLQESLRHTCMTPCERSYTNLSYRDLDFYESYGPFAGAIYNVRRHGSCSFVIPDPLPLL